MPISLIFNITSPILTHVIPSTAWNRRQQFKYQCYHINNSKLRKHNSDGSNKGKQKINLLSGEQESRV